MSPHVPRKRWINLRGVLGGMANIGFFNCAGPDHGSIVYARPPPTVEVLVDICSHILICAARIAAAVVAENNDVDYWRRCWN